MLLCSVLPLIFVALSSSLTFGPPLHHQHLIFRGLPNARRPLALLANNDATGGEEFLEELVRHQQLHGSHRPTMKFNVSEIRGENYFI